jgi:hypothetical protein
MSHTAWLFPLAALLFVFTLTTPAGAATYTVSTVADNGPGSLRQAVAGANASPDNDTIVFATGLTGQTITLSGGPISISNSGSLTIGGPGANSLSIHGSGNRIFFNVGATLTLRALRLTGGGLGGSAVYSSGGTLWLDGVYVHANNSGSSQNGAVFLEGGSNHRITNSTFAGNVGYDCTALHSLSAGLWVANSTFSGNTSSELGAGSGAICIIGGGAIFRQTTISGNTAYGRLIGGAGIYIQSFAEVNLGNTIVAGNTSFGDQPPDLFTLNETNSGTFTTSGGNLIGSNEGTFHPYNPSGGPFPGGNPNANGDRAGTSSVNSQLSPMLGPLQNNGGTTPTRALLRGSLAINNGLNTNARDPFTNFLLTTDQRGSQRIVRRIVDSGAYEYRSHDRSGSTLRPGEGDDAVDRTGAGVREESRP